MTVVVDFVYVAVATPTYVGVVAPSFWLWTATVQRQRTTLRPRTPALAGSTVFMFIAHEWLLTLVPCVFCLVYFVLHSLVSVSVNRSPSLC